MMNQPMHLATTALYAGLLALLFVVLSIRVTLARVKYKVDLGDGGKMEMIQALRIQGNLAEYLPVALILMALLENAGSAPWLIHTLGIVLLVARLAHAEGLMRSPGTTVERGIGATATWLVIAVGGILAIGMTAGYLVK